MKIFEWARRNFVSTLKKLFPIVFVLMAACTSVDQHIPCTGDGAWRGRLCREVRSMNEIPVGQIELSYPLDHTVEKVFRQSNGDVVATTVEVYESGRLIELTEDAGNSIRKSLFEYNALDSVSVIKHYSAAQLDSVINIEYQNGRRYRETRPNGWRTYQYFDNGMGPLYRISEYSAEGFLRHYAQYSYFGTGQMRIDHRLADHSLNGYSLIEFDVAGRPIKQTRRNAQGDLLYTTNYQYGTANRLVKTTTSGPAINQSSDFLYY